MAILTKGNGSDEVWTSRLGSLPLFVTLLLPLVLGILIMFKCLYNHCCIRKTTAKEELFGVEGRMTILANNEGMLADSHATTSHMSNTTSTNNNNSRPPSSISLNSGCGPKKSQATSIQVPDTVDGPLDLDSKARDLNGSLRATVKGRQLPDPPQSPSHAPRRSSSILSHDGASELYATVDEIPGSNNNEQSQAAQHLYSKVVKPKNTKASNNNEAVRNSTGEPNPSSDSETYAGSLHNPHHPYAKLKRPTTLEHPYAKVRSANKTRTGITETRDDAEETDTDNYDVAHPYAQINKTGHPNAGRDGPQQPSTSRAVSNVVTSVLNNSTGENHRRSEASENGPEEVAPIPPRRGRQWRRNSQLDQSTANEENPALFSGDSQDSSRGYSHLSVREPLATIKAQSTKNSDPNYAFVSDDSEDMYAAIDDPAAGNYMSIQDRPAWLGASSLVSPIPERREQNSPLPPTPVHPESPPPAPSTSANSSAPAIYAQVTKRNKNKAPSSPNEYSSVAKQPSSANAVHAQISQAEPEPRRWSKAEISYAEFEVVRESIYPVVGNSSGNLISHSNSNSHSHHISRKHRNLFDSTNVGNAMTYIDEDNYNVIPEPRPSVSTSARQINDGMYSLNRKHTAQEQLYQEIDEVASTNKSKPSNLYQDANRTNNNNDDGYYHEVGSNRRPCRRNKSIESVDKKIQRKNAEAEDSDDEDEDDFYEKVKSKPRNDINVPQASGQSSATNKNHGYEKLKKKPTDSLAGPVLPNNASDDDDDDETGFYEKIVKHPPRAQDPNQNNTALTTFNPCPEEPRTYGSSKTDKSVEKSNSEDFQMVSSAVEDVEQLYARVDKSRKTKKDKQGQDTVSKMPTATSKSTSHSHAKHSMEPFYSKVQSSPKGQGKIGSELVLSKDVTIEYI